MLAAGYKKRNGVVAQPMTTARHRRRLLTSAIADIWILAHEAGHRKMSGPVFEYSSVAVPSQRLRSSQAPSRRLLDHISLTLIQNNSDDGESISLQELGAGCCCRKSTVI